MRAAWISGTEALRERLIKPEQVAFTEPEAEMPNYMESFLAHLRLLIGVPFEYLIPDARLLPDESIRFFYLDRSWTDRLVDGALAVGKIGTREQAHHQAHSPQVSQRLDLTERIVRPLQRKSASFLDLKEQHRNDTRPADVVTGFLLRSAVVSGWPHMDVRAYSARLKDDLIPSSAEAIAKQLPTLRLERLSPSVMLTLFQGVPELVIMEEPHHGVQFGVHARGGGFAIDLRKANGEQIKDGANNPTPLNVPVRAANRRVIAVAELRKRLHQQRAGHPEMPAQTGSAAFAIEVLNPPWRQRFEGTKDNADIGPRGSGGFVSVLLIASRVTEPSTRVAVQELIRPL
jgi:hypothetical protein